MIINHSSLSAFFTGLKTQFRNSLASGEPLMWPTYATLVPSTTTTEDYGWIGEAPGLREWLGDRQITRLKAHDYTIKNREFELTIGVKRPLLMDDNTGQYSLWAQTAGVSARVWPDEIVAEIFLAGDTSACYDGQYFFDTDHPVGRESVSSVANLFDDGGANAAHPWYLLDTRRPLKPMIWQRRLEPEFTVRTRLDDEHVFMHNEYLAGVYARGNAGYALWQTAARCEGALSAANIKTAISAMNAFENDEGRLLRINPNIIMVGLYHQWTVVDIVKALYGADDATGKQNQLQGLQVVINPYLP